MKALRVLAVIAMAAGGIAFFDIPSSDAQSCRELQRACEMKGSLGERGEGNCRRFRERCGGRDIGDRDGGRSNRCERLRRACMFKDERGERGEGNCRQYREECGGGGRR